MLNENLRIGNTKDKGKTYFANKNFNKGEVVYYATGPIVFEPTDYTIPIGSGMFIDPLEFAGKYTNDYGLEANLGFKNRTQLVAMRDIRRGEEVGPAYFMFVPFYVPKSNADKLKLSSFRKLSKQDKEKFKEYISDYLFDEEEVKQYRKFLRNNQ